MKKKLKLTALLLTLTMSCSLLAGCGANKAPSDPVPEAPADTGSAAPAKESSSGERTLLADGNTYASGLPIVNEKVTFRIARGKNPLDSGTDTNEKPIMKLMEEATNIHIEWIDIPTGEGQK